MYHHENFLRTIIDKVVYIWKYLTTLNNRTCVNEGWYNYKQDDFDLLRICQEGNKGN